MCNFRIGVISNSLKYIQSLREYASNSNISLVIHEPTAAESAINIAKNFEDLGVEAIIARGRTYKKIRDKVKIPVIEYIVGGFDILNTIDSIKSCPNEVAIANSIFSDDIELVNRMLNSCYPNTNFYYYDYSDVNSLRRNMDILISQGIKDFIGGGITVQIALEKGVQGYEMYPNEKRINDIFEQVKLIIKVSRIQKEEKNMLNSVLNLINLGVAIITEDGNIKALNIAAEEIIPSNSNIYEILPKSRHWVIDKSYIKDDVNIINNKRIICDYIPLKDSGGIISINEGVIISKLEHKLRKDAISKGHIAKSTFSNIVGNSNKILTVKKIAKIFAMSDFNILLYGESGVGKELFAQSIHNASLKNNGPFIAINCGAIAPSLLESELFGYVEGAFTGAIRSGKQGLFELAHGGTIFLDEINSATAEFQTILLRVIEEKEIIRVGGSTVIPVDVRIISATNKKLEEKVREGTFRKDLYYRIDELTITIPPLRERIEDIDILIRNLAIKNNAHEQQVIKITEFIKDKMKGYDWPGNIRELENYIKRMLILDDDSLFSELTNSINAYEKTLESYYLNKDILNINTHYLEKINENDMKTLLSKIESQLLQEIIQSQGLSKIELAKKLGISRSTLWRKLNN